jgi:hypothetical protein
MQLTTALLLFLPAVALAQGNVTGRVVDELTGQPLPQTQVRLASLAAPVQKWDTTTGPAGQFSFAGIPAGERYAMLLQKSQYLQTTFPRPFLFDWFAVGADGLSGLEVKLTPQAVLAGVLVDPEGEPVEKVSVTALRRRTFKGQNFDRVAGKPSSSNDLGEFRIPYLSPGEYVLSVNNRLLNGSYTVAAGESREGIRAVRPPSRVSGRLSPPFGPSAPDTVHIHSRGFAAPVLADGTFSFSEMPPGVHTLIAADEPLTRCQTATLTVVDANVDNVTLRPVPFFTLNGRLRLEGSPNLSPAGQTIGLTSPCAPYKPFAVVTGEDGSFRAPGVPQMPITVGVAGPAGTYLREVRQNGAPVSGPLLGAGPVEIILSSGLGQISGAVDLPTGVEPMGITIYILPETPSLNAAPNPLTIPPLTTRFTFPNLAPGRYRLFASVIPPNYMRTEEIAAALDAQITTVNLQPGQTLDLKLPVITIAIARAAGIELDR